MRYTQLILLPPALVAGLPAAAVTLAGTPCAFTFNGRTAWLVSTETGDWGHAGGVLPAKGLNPLHLVAGALTTPATASGPGFDENGMPRHELHLTFLAQNGGLYNLCLDHLEGQAIGTCHLPMTLAAPDARAVGRPATLMSRGILRVVYRNADGALVETSNLTDAQPTLLTTAGVPPAVQDPVMLMAGDTRLVYYPGPDGEIFCLHQAASGNGQQAWRHYKVSNGGHTDAPAACGPLSAFLSAQGPCLCYRDRDGRVFVVESDPKRSKGTFRQLNAGGFTDAPVAAAGPDRMPLACLADASKADAYRIVYVTDSGAVVQIRHLGESKFQVDQLNQDAATGAPKAAGDLAIQFGAAGGEVMVSYLDTKGELNLLSEKADGKGWTASNLMEQIVKIDANVGWKRNYEQGRLAGVSDDASADSTCGGKLGALGHTLGNVPDRAGRMWENAQDWTRNLVFGLAWKLIDRLS